MIQVVKRDGETAEFCLKKITEAIKKAFRATGNEFNDEILELLSLRVTADFRPRMKDGSISVEEIQDSVEHVLEQTGYTDVAKAYILYRKQREKIRNLNSTMLDYKELVDNYLHINDWRVKENSTVTYSVGGLILSNSGAITANYWLSEIYDQEIADAHKSGAIHLHDLSMLTGYCAGWSLKQLIQQGLGIPGKINSTPASHLSTLCNQMVNFLGIMQNEWAGAQAFSSFDTYLAPFVKVDNLSQKEVKQCIQSFVFGVNTPSRWGTQAPFSNITLDWTVPRDLENLPAIVGGKEQDFTYGDCKKEMDMVNKAFIEIMTEGDAEILRYRKVKQKAREFYQIVLDRTPFYAEMGGQVGDTGKLISGNDIVEILQTKRENNLSIHIAERLPEDVTATFHAVIDKEARRATACNHTATHLLHEALREVLGTHVEQKGSYVSPQSLRFDFSHFQKVTDEELRKVEMIANRKVREAIPLDEHRNVPIAEAKAMGAMALFGEKYGEEVRVIRFGSSVELCGGTHVSNTGNIGMIKIITESSIAAGIRRIEAITGARVEETMNALQDSLKEIGILFNNAPNLLQAIHKAIDENAELRKQAEEYVKEKMIVLKDRMVKSAESIDGVKLIRFIGPMPSDMVKGIAFLLRGEVSKGLAFVAATRDKDKPLLTVMLSDDLVADGKNASAIVRDAAKLIQGGGGGQPYFAQAGGKNADKLTEALDKMVSSIVG